VTRVPVIDDIQRVTVVGAGVMGSGIAQVLAATGYDVMLNDVEQAQLAKALDVIENGRYGLRRGVEVGKLDQQTCDRALSRIRTTTSLEEACAAAQVVVEAVPEDLALKVTLFRQLDRLCPEDAALTSNTAGFPIAALAAATDRPGYVLGWHWSQPCAVMPFAELISHPHADPSVVDLIVGMAKRCRKNPIVINDQPRVWGFVANRISYVIRRECDRIVEEGVATPDQVDALMRDCFRWPMGPFELQRVRAFSDVPASVR
jgi:3-hydroxybutyryl-CoA dehydrogenase